MNIIFGMTIFKEVVESNSFSEAARHLKLSRSVVSRNIEALETEVGIRLINRTTRQLSLTDAGRQFYEDMRQILHNIDRLYTRMSELQKTIVGKVEISAPVHFGELKVLPVLKKFMEEYPEIEVSLNLSNRRIDLLSDHFDLVIQTAPTLRDSSFVMRRLGSDRPVVCASPDYCARHGTPQSPQDLSLHRCIASSYEHEGELKWIFTSPEKTVTAIPISPHLVVNAGSAHIRATKSGMGISLLPQHAIEQDLRTGELVKLLTDYEHESYAIYILYPHKELMPARTRKLLDILVKELARP